jgi:hypothetical protein
VGFATFVILAYSFVWFQGVFYWDVVQARAIRKYYGHLDVRSDVFSRSCFVMCRYDEWHCVSVWGSV